MKLKVMPDYGCWPVWNEGGDPYNVEPATLSITPALCDRLLAWAKEFDESLNWDDPRASALDDPELMLVFEQKGRRLAEDLQRELGSEVSVRYWPSRN